MRDYELMLVVQPELEDDDVNGMIEKVGEVLAEGGGEIASSGQLADKKGSVAEVTEGWKARRLAYALGGYREAYYVVLGLKAPPAALEPVERMIRLNDDVLRHLLLVRESVDA